MNERASKGPLKKVTEPASLATITDVADRAQVNVSTASRVLRGDPDQRVRPETRERIFAAAKKLKYEPNVIARALRGAKSFSLGIVVPQMDNPVFSLAIQGAERAAWERGYSLLIAHDHNVPGAASVYEGMVRSNRVDGLLVASLAPDTKLLGDLKKCKVPFVLFNRRSPKTPNCIALDGREAAAIAVRHLVALGHRRIAHLGGRAEGFNGPERHDGYMQGLREAGIDPDPRLVQFGNYTAASGALGMQNLLQLKGPAPTAVVAATLVAAAGALSVLHARGIDVPGAISIVGIHDLQIAELLFPPLTTVRLPTEAMGFEAAAGLIDLIEGKRETVGSTLQPIGLILRASTAAAPLSTRRT